MLAFFNLVGNRSSHFFICHCPKPLRPAFPRGCVNYYRYRTTRMRTGSDVRGPPLLTLYSVVKECRSNHWYSSSVYCCFLNKVSTNHYIKNPRQKTQFNSRNSQQHRVCTYPPFFLFNSAGSFDRSADYYRGKIIQNGGWWRQEIADKPTANKLLYLKEEGMKSRVQGKVMLLNPISVSYRYQRV